MPKARPAYNFFANVFQRCQGPKFTFTQPTYLNELSQRMYAEETEKVILTHSREGKIVFFVSV